MGPLPRAAAAVADVVRRHALVIAVGGAVASALGLLAHDLGAF